MSIADLPVADVATVKRLLAKDDWIMLGVYEDDEGLELLDALHDTDDPAYINYRWYRVDASSDEGDELLISRGIIPGNKYVIMSPYQGAAGLWTLDDLEGKGPGDLAAFMDDHAAEMELEEFEDEFDFGD